MSSDRPSVPYVLKYPWYMKLMAVSMVGSLALGLYPNPRPVAIELWEQQNFIFRLCMLLSAVLIPAGMAEICFFRIVFTESGIERRNKVLRSEFRAYSEIETVEFPRTSLSGLHTSP